MLSILSVAILQSLNSIPFQQHQLGLYMPNNKRSRFSTAFHQYTTVLKHFQILGLQKGHPIFKSSFLICLDFAREHHERVYTVSLLPKELWNLSVHFLQCFLKP